MNKLEDEIVKINMKELRKLPITEIHISIKNFFKLKCSDIDGDAPIGWLIRCLNDKDKENAINYILKQ